MTARALVDYAARVDRLLENGQQLRRSSVDDSMLANFVRESVPWSAEPIRLPSRLRQAIWALIPVQLVWGVWLGLIAAGSSSCNSALCAVTTLGRHAGLLLTCSAICLVGLVVLAPSTRGFARANAREITGLIVATAAGGTTLLGVAALGLVVMIAAVMVVAFFAAFTITP